jgi:large subunit ribosomal protein L25
MFTPLAARIPHRRRSSTAMSEVRIAAEPRTEFGKGGARRTRRSGRVPAVLYGHGQPPRHISLPARELMHALKTGAGSNVLLSVELSGKTELALPKEIQRHPIRGSFEHVDLVLVRRGEKVTVDIPVILVGEPKEVLVDQQSMTVSVEAEATHIPSSLEVDISQLTVGTGITAGELELPRGSKLITDADFVIVQGLGAPSAAQFEADLEGEGGETAAVEAPAAGEGTEPGEG